MITEDYVSFETAKLLKEKGYWNIATMLYKENGEIVNYNVPLNNKGFSSTLGVFYEAPTLQMAMKWLREVHNIHIELNPICTGDSNEDLEWHYGWAVRTTIFTDRWKRHDAVHISYEEAAEAAIKYCLENLI